MSETFVRRRVARRSLAPPVGDCITDTSAAADAPPRPSAPPASGVLASMADAFATLPDAAVVVDTEGTVVWGNRAAERLFGLTLDRWAGQSGLTLVHPDDQEFVLRSLVTVQDKEVGAAIEVRIRAGATWRLIEMVGAPAQWLGHDVIILCMRDLTQRRRFELASGDEARFRSLVHNAGSVIMLVSGDGIVESVSSVITRLLGHDTEFVEGRPLSDIVAPADRDQFDNALERARGAATSGQTTTTRIRLVTHCGTAPVPFELSIVNLLDDPTVEGLVISCHDATAQVAAERELVEALARVTATLDSTADGILVVNNLGKITDVNRPFMETWGIPADAITRLDDVTDLAFALELLVDPDAFRDKLRELEGNPEAEITDLLEFKDGRVVEQITRCQLVDGEVVGRVYSFRDVTDRKLLEEELSYRASHDSLTRLANKALFQDRLTDAIDRAASADSELAVLFIDLDDFKTVNDSLGHGEGDHLLRWVAKTLVNMLGPSDTPARLGGDEFAVLVEDVSSYEAVTELAQRILDALRPKVRLGTKRVSAASSIGIAFADPGLTAEQLLRNADIAMYQAKRHGKDRFEVYRDEMHNLVLARLELEEELKEAIANDDLVAYFQPAIDLETFRVVGFEALVRWPHPQGQLVDPRYFVPMAEELGLIGAIDAAVMRFACNQARQWQEEGLCDPDLHIGVNLSAGQLADPGLANRIADQLFDCGFDPHCLILEITESEVLTDDEVTMQNLDALRAIGVRIALDDFGTGYSTFLHLDRLPIDVVKIDKSLVDRLGSGDDTRSLAAALVQLSRTLGYETIAEGVESASQAESLRTMSCHLAQGYHFGKPLDADAARWLLAADGDDSPNPDPLTA